MDISKYVFISKWLENRPSEHKHFKFGNGRFWINRNIVKKYHLCSTWFRTQKSANDGFESTQSIWKMDQNNMFRVGPKHTPISRLFRTIVRHNFKWCHWVFQTVRPIWRGYSTWQSLFKRHNQASKALGGMMSRLRISVPGNSSVRGFWTTWSPLTDAYDAATTWEVKEEDEGDQYYIWCKNTQVIQRNKPCFHRRSHWDLVTNWRSRPAILADFAHVKSAISEKKKHFRGYHSTIQVPVNTQYSDLDSVYWTW